MKRKYSCVVVMITMVLVTFSANAQQRPYYTQYILNPYIINPALTGIENYWDVKFSYRQQWKGIKDSPQTIYITANGLIKRMAISKETALTVSPPGKRNPVHNAYWQNYKSAIPHAGIGVSLVADKAGPVEWYTINGSYAYHIGLTPKASLSMGISAGIQSIKFHVEKLDFGILNPSDPSVGDIQNVNTVKPDLSIGSWFYSPFYFVGICAQNVLPFEISFTENDRSNKNKLVSHLLISGGYKLLLNREFTMLPSTLVRIVRHAPPSVDVNVKLQYQNKMWIGSSFRTNYGLAAMLGMHINGTYNLGYSYDMTTSALHTAAGATHEVVVGILLGNRNRVLCPRDFW